MSNNQLIQSLSQSESHLKFERNSKQSILTQTNTVQEHAVSSQIPIKMVTLLTWWSWLNRVSPEKSFVGWMGGWALSSRPPLLGFLQSPAPVSNNRCAYDPHSGCLCCSCTIAYMKLMSWWPVKSIKADEKQLKKELMVNTGMKTTSN